MSVPIEPGSVQFASFSETRSALLVGSGTTNIDHE
jgi:hypothetical protein